MNPWALVIIGIGLFILIIGVKGTQHNIVPAITGKKSAATKPTTNPAVGMN